MCNLNQGCALPVAALANTHLVLEPSVCHVLGILFWHVSSSLTVGVRVPWLAYSRVNLL